MLAVGEPEEALQNSPNMIQHRDLFAQAVL